jgi:hypothetical protein
LGEAQLRQLQHRHQDLRRIVSIAAGVLTTTNGEAATPPSRIQSMILKNGNDHAPTKTQSPVLMPSHPMHENRSGFSPGISQCVSAELAYSLCYWPSASR